MQTHTGGTPRWLLLPLVVLALTACTPQVTRVPVETPSDLSGRWNDTDARVSAEAMIQDALASPWSRRFTQLTGRQPVVMVGTVLNRTHEHLNTQTFIRDLERALVNSGQVQFVADVGQRQEVRQERLDQANNARADTAQPAGQELGADFMLQGVINTLVDELDGTQAVFYQVDLELIEVASHVKVWLGQKNIKRLVERSKTAL